MRMTLSETLPLLTLNLMENEMIQVDPEAILLASMGGESECEMKSRQFQGAIKSINHILYHS